METSETLGGSAPAGGIEMSKKGGNTQGSGSSGGGEGCCVIF